MTLSHPLLPLLLRLGRDARAVVARVLRDWSPESRIHAEGFCGSDVIYRIDREVEHGLIDTLAREADALGGIVLVAEGIGADEKTVYPAGRAEADCAWRLLIDPIDGTRGIMTDKRSAWFLAGAAPNRGDATRLRDIDVAVLVELPNSRAGVADLFAAVRGQGCQGARDSLMTSDPTRPLHPQPYPGPSIRGGFAQLTRFFPPGRELMAALDDDLTRALFPDATEGEILCFEDQYISTGGQLAELLMGRDRFTADLRALLFRSPAFAGRRVGHCCHAYDLAATLVGEEAGLILTNADGSSLDAPFDTKTSCDWIGYANPAIRGEVEPVLRRLLQTRGWLGKS